MGISEIVIQNKSGEDIGVINTAFTIRSTEGVQLSADTATIELTADSSAKLYDEAADRLINNYKCVSTINGISGTPDGNFFILGSMCASVYGETQGPNAVLYITDLCPSCNSCDALLALYKEIEYYKIWMNAIKDINLYTDDIMQTRLSYMKSKRLPVPDSCDLDIGKYNNIDSSVLKGLRLFQQYITTVHMWNYTVTKNNSDTIITTAPEDSAGICIQAKRSVPSCGGDTVVACSISVSLEEVSANTENIDGPASTPISIYVPPVVCEFKPFDVSIPDNVGTITHEDILKKKVDAMFGASEVAGTYFVTAKMLPFRYIILKNKDGSVVNMRDFSWDIDSEKLEESESSVLTLFDLGGATPEYDTLLKPTKEDYNDSKTYPSISSPTSNRWQIEVSWTLQQVDGLSQTYTETFYYKCAGVRTFATNVLRDTELREFK